MSRTLKRNPTVPIEKKARRDVVERKIGVLERHLTDEGTRRGLTDAVTTVAPLDLCATQGIALVKDLK